MGLEHQCFRETPTNVGSLTFIFHLSFFSQLIEQQISKGLYFPTSTLLHFVPLIYDMVYSFKTPSPKKSGRSVTFASSTVKSDGRPVGSTNLRSTVGQYSRTDHTNTVSAYLAHLPHRISQISGLGSRVVRRPHYFRANPKITKIAKFGSFEILFSD